MLGRLLSLEIRSFSRGYEARDWRLRFTEQEQALRLLMGDKEY